MPAALGARGPPAPGSSPRTLHLSPRPVPAALARAQCPCSVLVVCRGKAHVLYARLVRLPSCRSEDFWRPWLRTPGEKEEREEHQAAEALPSGPGVTEASGKLSQYRHPVRLFWPKSKCYDYLYQEAETLLKNFPIQATISFYEDSDSEDEIEGLPCENQSN
ncbi:protein ripply2-like protein [Cricetulus griseus]|nr:protein ripply2-like protein [Cricetulus griseus]